MSNADSPETAFDWQTVTESKEAYRRKLAAKPIAEKLRMLDAMHERDIPIRNSVSSSEASLPDAQLAKGETTIAAVTELRVEQSKPEGRDFTYIDISSIDRETKRIIDPQILPVTKAPSRARQVLKAGDVLVSMTRPNLNAVALVPPNLDGATGSTGFHVLRATNAQPGFLYYAVQSPAFIDAMCRKVQGALYPAVRPKDISSFVLPTFSLAEQRRIVAEIEKQFTRLHAGVASLKRVQRTLKRYRATVLKAACEGRLVPTEAELARRQSRSYEPATTLLGRILDERRQHWQGTTRHREPASPHLERLPSLPAGWTWATPDQLSEADSNAICAGPFGTIFKAKDFRPAGVPIIFLRHVLPGRYITHKPGFMAEAKWKELFQPYSVFGGELLVTKLGEPPGVCAIYPEGAGPAMVTPDVIKLSAKATVVLPKYLMHYFNSDTARRFATGAAFGTTRLRLTLPIFREMPVPLPPLAEQERIVAEVERRLSVVDELDSLVTTNLQRAMALRQSILHCAFSGKLAISSSPDGEK